MAPSALPKARTPATDVSKRIVIYTTLLPTTVGQTQKVQLACDGGGITSTLPLIITHWIFDDLSTPYTAITYL